MQGDDEADDSPPHVELEPIELEEDQVDKAEEYEQRKESDSHSEGPTSAIRLPLWTSAPSNPVASSVQPSPSIAQFPRRCSPALVWGNSEYQPRWWA